MKRFLILAFFFSLFFPSLIAALLPAHSQASSDSEEAFREFARSITEKAAPLERDVNLTEWNAYVTGKKEDYKKKAEASLKLDLLYSNKDDYQRLIKFRDGGKIKDPLEKRKLELLINEFGPKQIEPELLRKINDKESEAQLVFNTYRGSIDGKEVSERDIYEILRTGTDRVKRQKAWEAQKGVGPKVAPLLKDLVKLRNEAARSLGFDNYYVMKVRFDDQDVKEINSIFKRLEQDTESSFVNYKRKLDGKLAERFHIAPRDLRPWDYPNPFFQDASGVFTVNIDRFFKGKDLPAIVSKFYKGAGLPIDDVLKRSDIYEKPGKSQHAFCYNIDRDMDIRVLLNMSPDEDSCATLLHELGHAAYDKNINKKLPWIFREPSQIFTTEASAMNFERLTKNPDWLVKVMGVPEKEIEPLRDILKQDLALQQLVFCRWTIVMVNFEQELYRNPDQELDSLWWTMVEKYQKLPRPEGRIAPDWASKIHFASAPVYYHNYMFGELMVSQMMHTMGRDVLKKPDEWTKIDYVNEPALGKWLCEKIYSPGSSCRWNELLEKATGETLNPRYFAEQFVEK